MRTARFLMVFGFCAVLLSACGGSPSKPYEYKSPEGRFSIQFPEQPKLASKTEVTAFGKQVSHFARWRPGAVEIYKIKLLEVSYTDCPATLASDSVMLGIMLDSSIRMRQKDFTEKDIHIESIELNGYPGRSFIYEVPNANTIAIVKQCIVNNKRYDITVMANSNQGTNPEVSNFFDSFQVFN